MRVLWFTNTPSNYGVSNNSYNGGGWISSIQTAISEANSIELGLCFLLEGQPWKVEKDGVTYYPVNNTGKIKKYVRKLKSFFTNFENEERQEKYLKVIDDFHPDIIHIFGTERDFGLIANKSNIPIVIHIQGLLNPCLNAFFPPGISLATFISSNINPLDIYRYYKGYFVLKKFAEREYRILKMNNHYIGRTEWDKTITRLYNHNSTYDYCGEILRDVFYHAEERKIPNRLVITTTISSALYKGMDMVLKCAKILLIEYNIDFEWRVFGNVNKKYYSKYLKDKRLMQHINLLGVATQNEICQSILSSTVFVHPSYIDNSPNSVGEAQMLGCPVVAQNVGGLSSMVNHSEDGFLVPANDPYMMADAIIQLFEDNDLNLKMGEKARQLAYRRHDKNTILKDLILIYEKYIKNINNQ